MDLLSLNFVPSHALDKLFSRKIFMSVILILNCCYGRPTAPIVKIKEAHRRMMVANHPDAGGSHHVASKINEAKDMLLGKTKGGGSAF